MERKLAIVAIAIALAQSSAHAQDYPNRPIRIVVPNTGGSAMDNVTRMIGQRLTDQWGQQIVVDNRPGAGSIIGHEIAAKAPADGYTLLFAASAGVTIQPQLAKVPYDSERDFAPITLVVNSIQVLAVHSAVAANTMDELLALARAKPGQLNCGTPGTGTSNHLACEMLKMMGYVNFVHVPFKGTGASLTGLLSGQVHISFASIPTTLPHVKAGRVRVLAQGGQARSAVIPQVPTIAETLPGYQATTWYALFAPRATPGAIITRLNGAVRNILSGPALSRSLTDQGLDPAPSSPAELASHIRVEWERFARIIKAAGLGNTP